jgi:hypothetical protein
MLDIDDDIDVIDAAPDTTEAGDTLQIIDVPQNSQEWLHARLGIPTASCFGQVVAPGRADQPSKQRQTYMLTLLGERLTGELSEQASSPNFDRGHRMEIDAANDYEFRQRVTTETIGFMRRGNVGCSPDRLITGTRGLVEIKSKKANLQLAAILADELPAEHKAQVQGGLLVSGYEYCDFVSYWPGLPLFVKRVYRDEAYIDWLRDELDAFNEELDALDRQMRERYYGGVAE